MTMLVGLLILQIILTCHMTMIPPWSYYHLCHMGKNSVREGIRRRRGGKEREGGGSEGRKADRCWNCESASLAGWS